MRVVVLIVIIHQRPTFSEKNKNAYVALADQNPTMPLAMVLHLGFSGLGVRGLGLGFRV